MRERPVCELFYFLKNLMLELANDLTGFLCHFVVVYPHPLQLLTDSEACRHCLRLRLRLHFSRSKMFGMIDKGFEIGVGIGQRRWQDGEGREALSIASGRVLVDWDREDEVEDLGKVYGRINFNIAGLLVRPCPD